MTQAHLTTEQRAAFQHHAVPERAVSDTHSKTIGYLCWLLGVFGAHRFYYGKRITGTIWFFSFGVFFVGWIVDFFLIPSMDDEASRRFAAGPFDYNVAWLLLTFVGVFGGHRFYMGKWLTGLLYVPTAGLFGLGWLYDFWTLNQQISELNLSAR